jgi:lambda family phage minor tail protein L
MTIKSDIQRASADQLVELFILDLLPLGIDEQYYLINENNELGSSVVFDGQTYTVFPIRAIGFQRTGNGKQPRPKLEIGNALGVIGALASANQDLVRAKFTRKRTLLKYLDAVNFEGGVNPDADPSATFNDEVWYLERKSNSNKVSVEWEMASSLDLEGKFIPKRQCIQNLCTSVYRSAECGYSGGPVATENDVLTSDSALDKCGLRVSSCKLRFPRPAPLPFGGFASITLIR